MTPRQGRMVGVGLLVVSALLASVLFLRGSGLKYYFHDPSEIASGVVVIGKAFNLGGMVKEGTFIREEGSLEVHFVVTDYAHDVTVKYSGLLPDLFREGQGVVATGELNAAGEFEAETILAKHDENYMPPDVADALKNKTEQP